MQIELLAAFVRFGTSPLLSPGPPSQRPADQGFALVQHETQAERQALRRCATSWRPSLPSVPAGRLPAFRGRNPAWPSGR